MKRLQGASTCLLNWTISTRGHPLRHRH